MLITMLSSWLFALNYICAETIQAFKNAPSSKFLCEKIGLYDLLLCLVYMLFHTLPNWERLVTLPVKAAGGDPVVILPYMILAILSAMVHMVTYFWIVKNSGAVSVGVMKSFQVRTRERQERTAPNRADQNPLATLIRLTVPNTRFARHSPNLFPPSNARNRCRR